jgi:predicted  nucleic acid-binding Zn-ribbon protein
MRHKKGSISLEEYCKKNDKMYLLDQWDYNSNEMLPSEIPYGSHKIVSWKCPNGHKYKKDVHTRCQGTGCSLCSGVVFKRRNKLFDEYPEFIKEIDTEKNSFDDLKNITCSSQKKIYWKCSKGHHYIQSASNKTKSKGCLVCSNKVVLKGYNDCETYCKNNNKLDVLKDWDYEKNRFLPYELSYGSQRVVFFKCHVCGNIWKTRLSARTLQNTGCNRCNIRLRSSFPEQAVYYYISKYFDDAITGNRDILNGKELDIYIPSCNVAIEYDGETWHKSSKRDLIKSKLCHDKGIKLIRIREKNCKEIIDEFALIYKYEYQNWKELNIIIEDVLNMLHVKNPKVDIKKDEIKIKEQFYTLIRDKSLSILYPSIASQWHPTLNGRILPSQISAETHDSYYWLCPKCGNAYKASVKNRIRMGSGCPKCGMDKRIKKQRIKVKNIDTGEIFESVSVAAEKYNCEKGGIVACCRGITKTSHGYRWQYLDRESSSRKIHQKQKTQKRVLNIDTGDIYETLVDAVEKTGIVNIQAVCNGRREKAGGYRWRYLDK